MPGCRQPLMPLAVTDRKFANLSNCRLARNEWGRIAIGKCFLRLKSIRITVLLWLVLSGVTHAQFLEPFESAVPSWERRESDCVIPDANWTQRRSNEFDVKNRFEKISFTTGSGTQILISHDIPPVHLIPELLPSVRIKASRPGTQVMVRVVLPTTPSPTGQGPLTTLLPGPMYFATGEWQTLSFAQESRNLQQKLQEEIWLLRRKHGSHVSPQNAYVDKIVLNLYSGPGETVVQVDDLVVVGMVDAKPVADRVSVRAPVHHDASVQTVGFSESIAHSPSVDDKQPSLVVRDGTVLLVEKKPFLPRIIQHQGESFEYLRSLGFNVVELTSTATYEQLQEARQLDLWIVCPPPPSIGLAPIEFQFDRVLAWSVGEELTGRNLQTVEQRIREIRESDLREGRPIVGHTATHWTKFAQSLDILSIGLEPIGTSFLASQYSDWISQRGQSISNNKPVWADIQTDFPKQLTNQISAIADTVPPTPIEPQQIKFLVYEAITGGARGLRFKSRSRLDGIDPSTRLRALTIEWLNTEISRLEPWIVAGALRGEIPTNDPELEVYAISTNRSRLLLIQRPTHHEQYWAGDAVVRTVRFRDPDTTFSERAMLISETGLQPLALTRNLGGNDLLIENCPYSAAVVLSQDPLIFNKLNQSYQRVGQASSFQLHTELTRQWLAIIQLIANQLDRMGRGSPASSGALNAAVNAFRNASSLIAGNSEATALPFLDQTDERLAFVRREMITEPLGMFQSKTSSPLVAHASLIPLHWELASRLGESQWNPNSLAGGDFEDLQHLARSGWENRRLDDDLVATKVELTESARVDGKYGLHMEVSEKSTSPTIDATPLWISSPRIPVRGGQLVRIHGWVNIPQVIGGNMDGLMIIDTLGGEAMAERIPVTEGWQEFTLYRGVASDRELQITFALTGFGNVQLDEVTIRTVDLPGIERQARAE